MADCASTLEIDNWPLSFEVAELISSSPKASGGGSFQLVCHIAPIDDQIVPLNE